MHFLWYDARLISQRETWNIKNISALMQGRSKGKGRSAEYFSGMRILYFSRFFHVIPLNRPAPNTPTYVPILLPVSPLTIRSVSSL